MIERTATRRDLRLIPFDPRTHAGLWFDKFLPSQERQQAERSQQRDNDPKKARHDHIAEVAHIAVPAAYATFFNHWRQALAEQQPDGYISRFRQAQVTGRMAVGLGAESVLETAVALHRTYGVPYIPGSALKGLAAAYTRSFLDQEKWGPETAAYRTLFGSTEAAGYVTFYDGLFVPDSGAGEHGAPLMPDVITVHHADYYQGKAAPAEWDSPNPVPFLTATGTYLLALAGPLAWVEHTFALLEKALAEMGVGAKTSSGYGRMRFVGEDAADKGMANTSAQTMRQQSTPTQTEPIAQRRAGQPEVGDVYQAMIIQIDEQVAVVQLEGLDEQRFAGVFRREHWEGKRYGVKNRLRLEVINLGSGRGVRTIVELKRAAMAPKAGEL